MRWQEYKYVAEQYSYSVVFNRELTENSVCICLGYNLL